MTFADLGKFPRPLRRLDRDDWDLGDPKPTGLTTMDGATITFTQPYLKTTLPNGTGLPLKVKAGQSVCFTVERPAAASNPIGRVIVTIKE